ncbi:MAG: dockerin type I domain-containing protein [Planctomycetota bacterium]|nr:dockerin type I domain-containing protein [Planctomycetota bacterium]
MRRRHPSLDLAAWLFLAFLVLATPGETCGQDPVQWSAKTGGNGHWYQFVFLPRECIEDSERRANELGASLVTIHSDGENAFVDALIPPYNGYYSVGRLGAFQDDDAPSPDSGWNWITGEPWSYTAWSPHNNQPSDTINGIEETHVVMYASAHTGGFAGWHDNTDSCGEVVEDLGWIIEWSADCNGDGIVDYGQILDGSLADDDGNGVPDNCGPIQWRVDEGGNGHWYESVVTGPITFWEAREQALQAGGDLASLSAEPEDSWMCDQGWSSTSWLGAYKVQGGDWTWLDGEEWGYTRWNQCEPNNSSPELAIMCPLHCDPSSGCGSGGGWYDYLPDWAPYVSGYLVEWSADCNGDGIVDYGQILDGSLADDDGDGVPDCCLCPGDFNDDGLVDAEDLGLMLSAWGTDGGEVPAADLDGDGDVRAGDLGLLLSLWGACDEPDCP